MPTILTTNGFRFFFYSNEHLPIHIHVEKGIRILVEENVEFFKNKWNEYFNNN